MPTENVNFSSNNLNIAGTLYLPESGTAPFPAIVVGHPMGGVKEQTATDYAKRLSEIGYAALVFDAAYQGASEGEPRFLEDGPQRGEDVKNAVSYLASRDDVDSDRIGALGICGSGGYVPFAAQTDQRIKAVATASAVNVGDMFRADPEGLAAQITMSNDARTAIAAGTATEDAPLLPPTKEAADSFPEQSMLREGYEYYKTDRGQHEASPGVLHPTSFDRLAQFDAWAFLDMISPRPLLLIAGTNADTLPHSESAYEKAAEPKELYLIEGASHFDLYDKRVDEVMPKLTEFFGENL